MKKAVFLDRDGTIMFDSGYVSDPEKVDIFEETVEALKALRVAGYLLVIITNQSGIARGYFTTDDLEKVNSRMSSLFKEHGVVFDGIYICPHRDEDRCTCRKPLPGLIFRAARELDIDVSASFMIGNSKSDVHSGIAAGCRLNFLLGGERGSLSRENTLSVDSLSAAAEIILTLEVL
ncbi:MAG TPA: HAD family hydrolase [Lentisphaeria bacterium]|nr:HAD family hydrolase [Lentisphaeria bacterium]